MASKTSATVLFLFLTLALLHFNLALPQAELAPAPGFESMCPIDVFELSVCSDVIGSLFDPARGSAAAGRCCSPLGGLLDFEAAVCICNAIKLDVLGVRLNIPLTLGLVLGSCGRTAPTGLDCA